MPAAAQREEPAVFWQPISEPQSAFLRCPVFEVLYEGERYAGKSDAMLGDFASDVQQGWGGDWRGILFRRTFPELAEIIHRSRQLYPKLGATFRGAGAEGFQWNFPDGETLLLRYAKRVEDIQNHLGHSFTWIGFNELTTWPSPEIYEAMFACCRSTRDGIPRRIRADTNPWGPGHGWVKARFVDPMPERNVLEYTYRNPITGESIVLDRCRVHGKLEDNTLGVENNPEYAAQLMQISDPDKRRAWFGSLYGSDGWDIAAGAFFASAWRESCHVIEPFKIPAGWRVDRCFDWGSAKPFWVGWVAEANGEEVEIGTDDAGEPVKYAFPRGTLFLVAELYGWNGQPNQGVEWPTPKIARKVLEREEGFRGHLLNGHKIHPGPADPAIYTRSPDSESIAETMEAAGVKWTKGDNSPGSRVIRWQLIKDRLLASLPFERREPMEEPGFFVFSTVRQFTRCLLSAPRDSRKPDDIDTTCEDHPLDGFGYRALASRPGEWGFARARRT